MQQRDTERILTSPFVSSWFGRARPGDRHDPDPARRAAAWAHWAITSLMETTGAADRPYVALRLEGRFHDPNGRGPLVVPHLEVPARTLERPDVEFPDRLAQMGNALAFPWWIKPEVTAAKRVLFGRDRGAAAEAVDALNERRVTLAETVAQLAAYAAPRWSEVESLLVSDPEGLTVDATGDFDTDTVAAFFRPATELGLSVRYEEKLRAASPHSAARRVGVWQVQGTNSDGDTFAFGVLTPRLTANSQFHDRLFAIDSEAPGALLVRGLLLSRLIDRHLGHLDVTVGEPERRRRESHLRAVPAKAGHDLPKASEQAAVAFLQSYPDPDDAWSALREWSARTHTMLTVHEAGFAEAHRRAMRFVRRAETPERDDINVVLPLGWDDQQRVVRVTFARRSA